MCSTDPTPMVNGTRLGPNAVILKVDQVIKPDAFLWRPSAEMSFIGDALNGQIPWPIHKVEMMNVPAREQIVRKSTVVNFDPYHFFFLLLGRCDS